uniref:Sentrin-specific protease 1-like n=1 Tax=Crassostrea virginica TaxID=6565 RepID=A0A8B8BIC4_CRAVI|nr:sentrin-specific protease 1-like [Crassostrea virginica]
MMPICLQHHWLLLVADVKKMTVSILDSLGGDHPEIENKWRKYMFTRERYLPEGLNTWTSSPQKVSKQKDGNSCGVFILMFAEAIVAGTNPVTMQQGHVKQYRQYVRQRLLKGASQDPAVCQIPFCVKPKNPLWTKCQDCGLWVHMQCSNLKGRNSSTCKEQHVCIICLWRQESKM